MSLLLLVTGVLIGGGFAVLVLAFNNAPEGVESETGFTAGSQAGDPTQESLRPLKLAD